jgi:hypothetical protein
MVVAAAPGADNRGFGLQTLAAAIGIIPQRASVIATTSPALSGALANRVQASIS